MKVTYKNNKFSKDSDLGGISFINELLSSPLEYYNYENKTIEKELSLIDELNDRGYDLKTLNVYLSDGDTPKSTKIIISNNILGVKYSSRDKDITNFYPNKRDKNLLFLFLQKRLITNTENHDYHTLGNTWIKRIEEYGFNINTINLKINLKK